jgi:hypothetical protein
MGTRTAFVAVWYDADKVVARAKARGWKEGDGGLLDTYVPEEDPKGADALECRNMKSAETHLRNIIAEGKDFYGVATIREFEVGGPRCQYCTCRGWKLVREHQVEEDGVTDTAAQDQCCSDED